jgi:hypothetical protein
MTVSSTSNRKTFTGDGVTVAFGTSPVVFFEEGDLTVYKVVTATGVATLQTITTDYAVTGGSGSTGTVTAVVAPAVGETYVIVRELDLTQEVDFVNNEATDAEVAEDALDRLVMIAQQLSAKIGRALVFADSDVSGASTVLPTPVASSLVGWNSLGTALQNYTTSVLGVALTTPFTLTLLQAASAAAFRALMTPLTTKGDLWGFSTIDARLAVGTDGYTLQPLSGAATGLAYLPPALGYNLIGGYLDWTVASNILTVSVKTWAGNDPSATEPVYYPVRDVTASTGTLAYRKLTAATTVAVPDTALMGTASSVAFRLWAVIFNDGGTDRLGVINCVTTAAGAGAGRDVTAIYPLAGFGIGSSTTVGTGADSAQVIYTGTGATSKAYTTLGYATWETGLATAGTWSAAPTRKQLYGPGVPLPGQILQVQRVDTGAVATGTTEQVNDDTIPQSGEGDQYMSQAITPTSAANALRVNVSLQVCHSANAQIITSLFQDATANALAAYMTPNNGADNGQLTLLSKTILAGATAATTFKVRAGGNWVGTLTFNGAGAARIFGGVMNSFLEAQEIMA